MSNDVKRRWRLTLGRYADKNLGALSGLDGQMDKSLDYLYSREYKKRGIHRGRQGGKKGPGSLDPTQMSAIDWLGGAQNLFPESVFKVLQDHALDRYGLSDLLKDPKTLESLEPNKNLLKVLLGFHGRANPNVKEKLRAVADSIIKDIMKKLNADVERAFSGRRNRFRRSNIKSAANFDWRATLRVNLKTYDTKRKRIIAEQLRFNAREKRRLPWTVILCVDQSGSMTDSLVYSAVMASILAGLPGINVKMVLFDTSIVDVSDNLVDPLDTLLSVQLGGGTDIGKAVRYCEQFVENGDRTVFTLITDFCEGASPRALYASVARLAEARVRLIGLAALDDSGLSFHDEAVAGRLVQLGMKVATMTPDRLADWLAEVMS